MLYNTTIDDVPYRLISIKPIWKKLDVIKDFNVEIEWQVAWFNNIPLNGDFVIDPNKEVIVMQYNRRNWVTLNRFKTEKSRCNQCFLKWRTVSDGSCDSGAEEQSMAYIILSCPLRRFNGSYYELLLNNTKRSKEWIDNLV